MNIERILMSPIATIIRIYAWLIENWRWFVPLVIVLFLINIYIYPLPVIENIWNWVTKFFS